MRFAEILKLAASTESEFVCGVTTAKTNWTHDPDEFVLAHEDLTLHELLPQNHTMIVIDAMRRTESWTRRLRHQTRLRRSWSLAFTRWERWLGMEIAPSTLQRFSPSEILAHCLYG